MVWKPCIYFSLFSCILVYTTAVSSASEDFNDILESIGTKATRLPGAVSKLGGYCRYGCQHPCIAAYYAHCCYKVNEIHDSCHCRRVPEGDDCWPPPYQLTVCWLGEWTCMHVLDKIRWRKLSNKIKYACRTEFVSRFLSIATWLFNNWNNL